MKNNGIMGGKNLFILGVASIVIAVATTSVSLIIYRNSGDIYLDRSRPGFLPDLEEVEEEAEEKKDERFDFLNDEKVTKEMIEAYVDSMEANLKVINGLNEPFDPEVLSDEHLGTVPGMESASQE